jgi:hypothetical protein
MLNILLLILSVVGVRIIFSWPKKPWVVEVMELKPHKIKENLKEGENEK